MADDFVATYAPLANDIATRTGLDPSVVLGIIDTETGGGKHVSGNNIFGISPIVGGRQVVAGYPDVQTAADAFIRLMQTPRYASVAAAPDPASQATALVRGGYNTANPQYAQIVAGKALNFGKQLGYQDSSGGGGGSPQSGPAVYSTTSQPAPDYNDGAASATVPAPQQQAAVPPPAPDYNTPAPAAAPAQPQPAPAKPPAPSSPTDQLIQELQPSGGGGPAKPPAAAPATSGKPPSATDDLITELQQPPAPGALTGPPAKTEQAPTTWRGAVQNFGAGLLDTAGNVINVLSNPSQLVLTPAAIAFGTAYDAGAHLFGYTPLTPEQRADLYGQPQPGQTQLPPEQQQIGTRAISALDTSIPGPTAANLPATPTEATIRAVTGGAGTAASLGPGGLVPALAGGVGAGVGHIAAQFVPDWLKSGVELAGNVGGAAATGGAAQMVRTPVGLVDAGKAALADTAIKKYRIPVEASDITDDPRFARTGPASIAATTAKQEAWQGNIVKEMGDDGNKFTPQLMRDTATRTGQVYDDVANRTTIGQPQTDNLVHNDLAAIEANLDHVAGITDSDRAVIRRRLSEVVDAVQPNGTISGADYRALTKTGSPLDRLEGNSNSEIANIGGDINQALRKAFNSSASPADQAALAKNDYQYRIMKTVQDLAAKSPDGNINPKEFMTKVTAASRRFDPTLGGMAYTGGGNIGELAKIGSMIDTTPKFAPRTSVGQKALTAAAEIAATGLPGYFLHPGLAAVAPAIAGAAYLRGAYLPSDMARNTMIRNALIPPPSPYSGVVGSLATGGNPLLRP